MTRTRSAHADHVVDLGPGAGVHGGEIVAAGHARRRSSRPRTASPPIISPARAQIEVPAKRRKGNGHKLTVHGARGQQPARTSPPRSRSAPSPASPASRARASRASPSTRSTPRAARTLNGARVIAGPHDKITGLEYLRQGDRDRPVADRPHPALQPGDLHRRLHPDPRLVRRPARKPGARLQARALQLQRQGRPLRGVPGRRADQDRDALPARRLRHLRGMPRQALQPRNAGGEVQGPLASPTCST